jgi:protein-S-isoprenylcysteine O-methyltransferase Ste14
MSLIPAFEIGLWNAWLFIIPDVILWIVGVKFIFKKRMPDSEADESRREKVLSFIMVSMMFALYIYSIFLPLKLGTIWFYSGLIIYIIGMILIVTTMVNFVTTPRDKPVTKGLYRFSRNPMFIGFYIILIGIGVACASWVYLLGTFIFILIVASLSPLEEKMTLEHYGKPYEEYMKRTPKWIGIPGQRKKR